MLPIGRTWQLRQTFDEGGMDEATETTLGALALLERADTFFIGVVIVLHRVDYCGSIA
jgi:hypothetical protein